MPQVNDAVEQVQVLVPPTFKVFMSGCCWIRKFPDGRVEATYTDGTSESVLWPEATLNCDTDFFSLLGTLQQRARHK